MPFIFLYLIKLSLSLSVVFLFYRLVLRKITFYNCNRWYLFGYTLLCFVIPFIDISSVMQQHEWNSSQVVQWLPTVENYSFKQITTEMSGPTSPGLSVWNVLGIIILAGMGFLLLRLITQLFSFRRIMKNARLINNDGMKLYHVDESIIPFSFGNSIFVNRHQHNSTELEEIIRHEFVHVKQKHSIDILWGELLFLLNWYNPFAWLLKKAIRQNLEFIADNKVLENGIDPKQYQYLLLKVIGNNQFSIANQFNFSSLKKRIAMMNKMKSTKKQLLRLLFLLPATCVLLLAFRHKMDNKKAMTNSDSKQEGTIGALASISKEEHSNELHPILEKLHQLQDLNDETPDLKTFLKRNPDVASVAWSYDSESVDAPHYIVITKKNGSVEKYNLGDEASMEKAKTKYGTLPAAPPPPPPPGETPNPPSGVIARAGDDAPLAEISKDLQRGSIAGGTDIAPIAGDANDNVVSSKSHSYEITDSKAVIVLDNGKKDEYDLTKPSQRAAFEAKYGKVARSSGRAPLLARNDVSGTLATTPRAGSRSSDELTGVIDSPDYEINGQEDVVVTITGKTTKQQLDEFIIRMKDKGVTLKFETIQFSSRGTLTRIEGSMVCKDSESRFSAVDFDKLILAMYQDKEDNKRIYFKVNTKDKVQI